MFLEGNAKPVPCSFIRQALFNVGDSELIPYGHTDREKVYESSS